MNENLTTQIKNKDTGYPFELYFALFFAIVALSVLVFIYIPQKDKTITIDTEYVDNPIVYDANQNCYVIVVPDQYNNDMPTSMELSAQCIAQIIQLDKENADPYVEYNGKEKDYTIYLPKGYKIPVV